jgi:DNA damage-inducible protein 1
MKDDDMVVVHTAGNSQGSSSRQQQQQAVAPQPQQPHRSQVELDPEMIRLQVLGDPQLQTQLRETNPELWDARNDPEKFNEIFKEMQRQKREAEMEKQREIVCLCS